MPVDSKTNELNRRDFLKRSAEYSAMSLSFMSILGSHFPSHALASHTSDGLAKATLINMSPEELKALNNKPHTERQVVSISEAVTYNIKHDLTDSGLAKFAQDWKSIFNTNNEE